MRRLDIVGTGLVYPDHLTEIAASLMAECDLVLAQLDEGSRLEQLRTINPNLENLNVFYGAGKDRLQTYEEMAQRVVKATLEEQEHVVMAAYGNPGFLCLPTAKVQDRLQSEESVQFRVHSGVSALDCLVADLAVDAESGIEAYEVNNLLVFDQQWDTNKSIVLWQIATVGEFTGAALLAGEGLQVASEELCRIYGPDQELGVYLASVTSDGEPDVIYTSCLGLREVQPYRLATLYIPPKGERVHQPVPKSDAQLQLVGLGYRPSKDTTRRSLELIEKADSVFCYSLSDAQNDYLKSVRKEVRDFSESQVLQRAEHGATVVVFPNHPSYCGGAKLVQKAGDAGIRARIEPSTSFLSEVVLLGEADFDSGHQWFANGSGNPWCPGVSLEPLKEEVAKSFQVYSLKLGDSLAIQKDRLEPPFLLLPLESPPSQDRARLRLEKLAASSLALFHLNSLPPETLTGWRLHNLGKEDPPAILKAAVEFSFAEIGKLCGQLGLEGDQEKMMAYYVEHPNSALAHLVNLASNCQRAQQALAEGIPQERARDMINL